jgi:mannose-6-phosphate isomerase
MYHLINKAQNYDWGKSTDSSLVYKYIMSQYNHNDTQYPTHLPYAELWMGSHKNAESSVLVPSEKDALTYDIVSLSKFMDDKLNYQLPYLFKILSVKNCLSIQAHPNKGLAELLHAKDPKNYPDDNHKPEMAIALSNFKAFSNFAPGHTIILNLRRYGCLSEVLDIELTELEN